MREYGLPLSSVAEIEAGNRQRAAFDVKLLDGAVAIRIRNNLMFDSRLQPMGGEKLAHRVRRLLNDRTRSWQRAVIKINFGVNRVVEFAVGKPRQVVEIRRHPLGFVEMKRHDDSIGARLKIVFHMREDARLHQLIRRSLQIVAAHLLADLQAAQRSDLLIGERFQPVRFDFAKNRGRIVLRRSGRGRSLSIGVRIEQQRR
jgi:hypothetical protein